MHPLRRCASSVAVRAPPELPKSGRQAWHQALAGMGTRPKLMTVATLLKLAGMPTPPELPRMEGLLNLAGMRMLPKLARPVRLSRLLKLVGMFMLPKLATVARFPKLAGMPMFPELPRVEELLNLAGMRMLLQLARPVRLARTEQRQRRFLRPWCSSMRRSRGSSRRRKTEFCWRRHQLVGPEHVLDLSPDEVVAHNLFEKLALEVLSR